MNPSAPSGVIPIGDTGYALVGFGLTVSGDAATGDVILSVVGAGGRVSEIVGIRPVQAALFELARIPAVRLAELFQSEEAKRDGLELGRLLVDAGAMTGVT